MGMPSETEPVKKNNSRKPGLLILLVILGVLAALYIVFSLYYHQHFLPNTRVNGIETGGMNAAEVEALITDQVKGYELAILRNDGETETLSGAAIGIRPAFQGEISELIKEQPFLLWPLSFFKGQELSAEALLSYDEKALEEEKGKLSLMAPENQIPPEDAHVSDFTEDGFVVEEGDPGSTIDQAAFSEALHKAILGLWETLDLTEEGCYLKAKVQAEDPGLKEVAEELNRFAGHTITYDMGEKSRTLKGDEIASLLTVDESNRAYVDEEKVTAYVRELAEETDTYGLPHDFMTSSGNPITFQTVYYGWEIDQEAEAKQLMEDLLTEEDVKREPIYLHRAASHGEKDYGDTYVEVNLSAQHMYCYKDGALALDADCVTGCIAKGTITHVGLYPIYSKERDRDLVGENYRSFVNYWMPFNGGEGLHDASWRSSYGGGIYLTNGSHGCVNLAKSVAAEVYDIVEIGTPVFIYRMNITATTTEEEMAKMAVSAINSVGGHVTLGSETAIKKARNIYNYLSSENKGLVTNIGLLSGYEAQLNSLKSQAAAAQAAQAAALQAALAQAGFLGNE